MINQNMIDEICKQYNVNQLFNSNAIFINDIRFLYTEIVKLYNRDMSNLSPIAKKYIERHYFLDNKIEVINMYNDKECPYLYKIRLGKKQPFILCIGNILFVDKYISNKEIRFIIDGVSDIVKEVNNFVSIINIFSCDKNDFRRDAMISFIRKNPFVKISHKYFDDNEYIYSDLSGIIYDDKEARFEDWESEDYECEGIRCRTSDSWQHGWKIVGFVTDEEGEPI